MATDRTGEPHEEGESGCRPCTSVRNGGCVAPGPEMEVGLSTQARVLLTFGLNSACLLTLKTILYFSGRHQRHSHRLPERGCTLQGVGRQQLGSVCAHSIGQATCCMHARPPEDLRLRGQRPLQPTVLAPFVAAMTTNRLPTGALAVPPARTPCSLHALTPAWVVAHPKAFLCVHPPAPVLYPLLMRTLVTRKSTGSMTGPMLSSKMFSMFCTVSLQMCLNGDARGSGKGTRAVEWAGTGRAAKKPSE